VNNVVVVDSQETSGNFVNTKMGVKNMKRTFAVSFFVIAVLALMIGPAMAGKPSQDDVFNGNGFPSGPHHNLNIIAKKPHFSCPPQQWEITACPGDECGEYYVGQVVDTCPDDFTCVEHYGNVIFIPREQGDDPITILMESGRKGPKPKPGVGGLDPNTLQVTDWCTESFPDDGSTPPPLGDEAVLQLPADPEGYAVYGRLTGKPGEVLEPWVHIEPGLAYVQDEDGNDLLLLGLVDADGVYKCPDFDPENPDADDPCTLVRTDDVAKGKGVQKAKEITHLFTFNGWICYLDPADCEGDCYQECWCCCDDDADGDYDHCEEGVINDNGTPDPGDDFCDCAGLTLPSGCVSFDALELSCRDYTGEDYWIFNIADFVGYLWDIDSNGAYVVQIRFYPLPLNAE
jgi:hypothetical protein